MAPKRLVCDRCGFEITDKGAIDLAMAGTDSWIDFVIEKGDTPRGFFPCVNYVRCGGEMVDPGHRTNPDGHNPN